MRIRRVTSGYTFGIVRDDAGYCQNDDEKNRSSLTINRTFDKIVHRFLFFFSFPRHLFPQWTGRRQNDKPTTVPAAPIWKRNGYTPSESATLPRGNSCLMWKSIKKLHLIEGSSFSVGKKKIRSDEPRRFDTGKITKLLSVTIFRQWTGRKATVKY